MKVSISFSFFIRLIEIKLISASIQGIKAVKFVIDGWVYSEESDILIDNLEFTKGCSSSDITMVETFECNFDAGDKCTGVDGEADFIWEMGSSTTPSKSTGPLGDHTTGRGKYLYIEASQPRQRGDRAQYVTPPLTEDLHCLSFWYHMYGEETGSMRVKVKIGKTGRERVLWEEKGEKPDKWYRAEIEVNPAFFQHDDHGIRMEAKENTENDIGNLDYREENATALIGQSASEPVYTEEVTPVYDYDEVDYPHVEALSNQNSTNRRRREAGDVDRVFIAGMDVILTESDFKSWARSKAAAGEGMMNDAVRKA